jgi:hypothetical protein
MLYSCVLQCCGSMTFWCGSGSGSCYFSLTFQMPYYFCMMMEGSRSRFGAGSGSIPLTSGSGSGRPKNIWIRWIRIRIRIRNTGILGRVWAIIELFIAQFYSKLFTRFNMLRLFQFVHVEVASPDDQFIVYTEWTRDSEPRHIDCWNSDP